jgi:hypothetical protein
VIAGTVVLGSFGGLYRRLGVLWLCPVAGDNGYRAGAASSLYTLSRRIGGNLGCAFVANQLLHRTAFHHARLPST